MSDHTIIVHKPLLVHKGGLEGAFKLYPYGNGDTAGFRAGELPDWAADEHIAVADLKGLREWLTARIGADEYAEMTAEDKLGMIPFDAIEWTCITDTEELVTREASADVRAEWLGDILGLDREVADFDAIKADAEAIHKSYVETPTDERSLAEAEGKTFGEVAGTRTVANG